MTSLNPGQLNAPGGTHCTSSTWESIIEDLVPLSTQLVTPALAEAFEIPTPKPPQSSQLPSIGAADQSVPTADFAQRSQFGVRANPPGAAQPMLFPGYFPPTAQQALPPQPQGLLATGGHFPGWLDSAIPTAQLQQPQTAGRPQTEANVGSDPDTADDYQARALKRPRLVWTAQLHQRFVDAVAQLGLKNAVPKTIMQLMNVDGLTRENVASHLQKYRLQLRKEEGKGEDQDKEDDEDNT